MKELVFFWGSWCEYCKAMDPIVDEFEKENPDVKVTRIDVESNDPAIKHYFNIYRITSVPLFIGMVDSKVIDGHQGTASKFMLKSLLG